jgi:hypothetical protein
MTLLQKIKRFLGLDKVYCCLCVHYYRGWFGNEDKCKANKYTVSTPISETDEYLPCKLCNIFNNCLKFEHILSGEIYEKSF